LNSDRPEKLNNSAVVVVQGLFKSANRYIGEISGSHVDEYESSISGMVHIVFLWKLTDIVGVLTACIFRNLIISETSVNFYDITLRNIPDDILIFNRVTDCCKTASRYLCWLTIIVLAEGTVP
jgi:hypothetical protein